MPFNTGKFAETLFCTAAEVAEITGLSIATIRRAIRDKRLKAYKFGRAVRIHREDLGDYIGRSRGEQA